jgi:hypothetical protein
MKPHNLANRFRQKRMQLFLELLSPHLAAPLRILDVGGTAHYWHALPGLYGRDDVEITVVNLGEREFDDKNLKVRHGDARDLWDFADQSFDVLHSNSVIEHVGLWKDMQRMASEVRRLAPSYFVQTPNVWFPFEPHYRLPMVHWLPEQARAAVIDKFDRYASGGERDPIAEVQKTFLLSVRQMRALFPDADICRERFGGLTKSIIAIRRGAG